MQRFKIEWVDEEGNAKYYYEIADSKKEAVKKWHQKLKKLYKLPLKVLNKKLTLLAVDEVT